MPEYEFPKATSEGGHIAVSPASEIQFFVSPENISPDDVVARLHNFGLKSATIKNQPDGDEFIFVDDGGQRICAKRDEWVAIGRELRTECACVVLADGSEPHKMMYGQPAPGSANMRWGWWKMGVSGREAYRCMADGWKDGDPSGGTEG